MNRAFERGSETREALRKWWLGLADDRGTRAELRRCGTTLQVTQVPGFHQLRAQLLQAGLSTTQANTNGLVVVAGVLSSIKESGDKSPPLAFSEGESVAVSPLRFRQLLEAREADELLLRLRRVLPLASGIDAMQLAFDAFHWNDETRKQWVYAYRWPSKSQA
ncbi:type I-E CRISPR-associated protein Cse2/CasB [Aquimonas sp.]|jgi:CRISPR system Cascade subunit CasB|uniref:type I-E CRISPR-associated protein Cse2/CasB n=1 Tax=Aquimonas sp. TaxID=1872588 RepID=UPI0037C171DE